MAYKYNLVELDDIDVDESGIPVKEVSAKKARKPRSTTAKKKATGIGDLEPGAPVPLEWADTALRFPNDELDFDSKIGIDSETTGLLPRHGDMPWMFSMADMRRHSWCASAPVDVYTRKVHWDKKDPNYIYLKHVCEDRHIAKTFFHRKFDVRQAAAIDIVVRGNVLELGIDGDDVALMARVFKTDEFNYKLKPLAEKYKRLSSDDEAELAAGTTKLRKRAKKLGWKIFDAEETTNSAAKKDKSAPDYWLCQYAHLLYPEDPIFAERMKYLGEEYCRKDTLRTVIMDDFYTKEFEKVNDLKRSYHFELMLSPLVEKMEDRGIKTFRDIATRERRKCLRQAEELKQELIDEVGDPNYNPGSDEQYSKYLFNPLPHGLGLPPTERTKTGHCKVGYKEIAHLAWHPFIQKTTRYNALCKAVSLFFDKYIDVMLWDEEQQAWIVNAEINQNNTKTFRFSFSNPNLQQAANPETSARGANVIQVRNAFGPRDGYDWWMMDYSGQELRILGGLMKVQTILDAVRDGKDIPTEIGNKAFGGRDNASAIQQTISDLELDQREASTDKVRELWQRIGWYPGKTTDRAKLSLIADQVLAEYDYKIVTLEESLDKSVVRTRTKMCLYGKAYGAGAKGLVGLLLCKEDEARAWLRDLDTQFPEMNKVAASWASFARQKGYITNAYGRRLNVDPDFAYKATNYRIQGSAAEMMKIAMLRCDEYLKSTGLDAHIILTVHDELIFEINRKHAYPWLLRELKRIMEDHERYFGIKFAVGISRVRERWDLEEKKWEYKIQLAA